MLVCFRAVPLPLEDHRFQRDFRLFLPQLTKTDFVCEPLNAWDPMCTCIKVRGSLSPLSLYDELQ